MQLRIGLTGGIGSGKTTVARIFEVLGVPVYYADDAAKRLMNSNEDVRKSIIKAFGEEAYTGKQLNRNYIASLVFADKDKLALLNALTHPATINDANEWMKRQTTPYTIKEAALIFEAGSNKYLDFVIGVMSPLDLRIRRVSIRDNVSEEVVKARIARQMNEEEKMNLCDYVIINDEKEFLIPQVLHLNTLFLDRVTKNQAKMQS